MKREKIRYKITPKGENEKDTTRSEVLLKMYLSTDKNVDEMKKHIIQFKEESEQKLELFNLFDADLNQNIELHNLHVNLHQNVHRMRSESSILQKDYLFNLVRS